MSEIYTFKFNTHLFLLGQLNAVGSNIHVLPYSSDTNFLHFSFHLTTMLDKILMLNDMIFTYAVVEVSLIKVVLVSTSKNPTYKLLQKI